MKLLSQKLLNCPDFLLSAFLCVLLTLFFLFYKDIVGTGRTMKVLLNNIEKYKPKMIKVARWVKQSQNLVISLVQHIFQSRFPFRHPALIWCCSMKESCAEELSESLRAGWRKGGEMFCIVLPWRWSSSHLKTGTDGLGRGIHPALPCSQDVVRKRNRTRTGTHMAQKILIKGIVLCVLFHYISRFKWGLFYF